MKNIYLQIPARLPDISELVLTTIVATEGSTPQKPGISALFDKSGLVAGTVGGGIFEHTVQKVAAEALITRNPSIYKLTLDNRIEGGEDALCGGRISVLIDPCLALNSEAFEALRISIEKRVRGFLITELKPKNDGQYEIKKAWIPGGDISRVPVDLKGYFKSDNLGNISQADSLSFTEILQSGNKGNTGHRIFVEKVIPRHHLVIAGAGHIGKALSKIGNMLDFEVTVIDDRPEYANSKNIPEAEHIITGDIGKAIEDIEKRKDTFIVIVTRGHKDDSKALKACIGSGAGYVGMIGSKNKVAIMKKEYIENGWATEEIWNSIFAPVGLDINSQTVEEIAVSIAAQLVMIRSKM